MKSNEQVLYKSTKVVWYLFYALEVLLFFRFFLKLLGANPAAGFTNLIYTLTFVPLAPFRYVFGTDRVGDSVFEWSTLLALAVYWFVAWGIVKLMLMGRPVNRMDAERGLEMQDDV